MNNVAFYLNGKWDPFGECDDPAVPKSGSSFYLNVINGTQVEEVASTAAVFEHKLSWVDNGSYVGWHDAGDGNGDNVDADGKVRFSGWNWGGGKWDDRAMVAVFMDSHAKRTAMSSACGDPSKTTFFGWKKNDLSNHAPGGDMSWLYTFCDTMPAKVK